MERQDDKTQQKQDLHVTWKTVMGGGLLLRIMRRQTTLVILVMVFIIVYIDNRYSSQQEMIEIDELKRELVDIKYDALTVSSELTERSRQSRIEEYITAEGTPLETSTTPPFLIKDSEK